MNWAPSAQLGHDGGFVRRLRDAVPQLSQLGGRECKVEDEHVLQQAHKARVAVKTRAK